MSSILIVEDDDLLSHMYDSLFSENGFSVEVAGDGVEGLERAQRHPPDIILMDIMMPKVDGLTLLKRIKAEPALKPVPVVVITSLTDSATPQTALKLGAIRYLQKSEHKPRQVLEIVKEILAA